MNASSDNCIMCQEINATLWNTPLQSLAGDTHRIVAETENFVAIPTIGALCSGYMLVVPKKHLSSFSQLSKNEFDELHNFLSKIKKAFSSKYQAKSLIFEHGIVAPKSRRVKHAHLHILPDSSNLGAGFLASIRSEIGANGICIKSLFDIAQSQYPAYIFTEVLGEMWLFKDNENTNNRMHLRKKIAEVMGNPEIWDWALYPHQDFIQQTLFDLKISNNL